MFSRDQGKWSLPPKSWDQRFVPPLPGIPLLVQFIQFKEVQFILIKVRDNARVTNYLYHRDTNGNGFKGKTRLRILDKGDTALSLRSLLGKCEEKQSLFLLQPSKGGTETLASPYKRSRHTQKLYPKTGTKKKYIGEKEFPQQRKLNKITKTNSII